MLSSRHSSLVLGLLASLALAGCNIRPLYAPPTADASAEDRTVVEDLASVSVDPIADRRGQMLRNRLSAMLRADDATEALKYRLNIELNESEESLALRRSGFATRSTLRITAVYRLFDNSTGQPVLAGSANAMSSYDLLDSDFSTLAAINDARARVVDRLAGDLRNRLAVYFASQPPAVVATP